MIRIEAVSGQRPRRRAAGAAQIRAEQHGAHQQQGVVLQRQQHDHDADHGPPRRPAVRAVRGVEPPLVHIGCGFIASSWTPLEAERPFNTCSSACPEDTPQKIRYAKCDGYGCCEAPILTGGLTSFRAQFRWTGKMRTAG